MKDLIISDIPENVKLLLISRQKHDGFDEKKFEFLSKLK